MSKYLTLLKTGAPPQELRCKLRISQLVARWLFAFAILVPR